MKKYPNNNEIFKQKERHRRRLSALSFEQKIEMIFKLKERRKFFEAAREASNRRSPARANGKFPSDPQEESA